MNKWERFALLGEARKIEAHEGQILQWTQFQALQRLGELIGCHSTESRKIREFMVGIDELEGIRARLNRYETEIRALLGLFKSLDVMYSPNEAITVRIIRKGAQDYEPPYHYVLGLRADFAGFPKKYQSIKAYKPIKPTEARDNESDE